MVDLFYTYLYGMNYKRIVELLEDQLRLFAEREKAYLEQISS